MGEFSQYIEQLGRPYLWVQWLCGIQVLSVCDDQPASSGAPQLSLSAIHMEGTIKRLRKRMKHRLSLHRQLSALGMFRMDTHLFIMFLILLFTALFAENGIVAIDPDCYHLFPAKINSRLSSWKRSTYEDFQVSSFNLGNTTSSVH
jgi:THO complex subunit 5